MSLRSKQKVLISPPEAFAERKAVWDALAALTHVTFAPFNHSTDLAQCHALILCSGDSELITAASARNVRCFVTLNAPQNSDATKTAKVSFSAEPALDRRLRGRNLPDRTAALFSAVPLTEGDRILTKVADRPIWIQRQLAGVAADISSATLPLLKEGEDVFDFLNGDSFIQTLPLLHFLRSLNTSSELSAPPPLRASFMFDDPNLHWPSYGFLPFRRLVDLAKECRFHVCFATVPLDAWLVVESAAKIFREHSREVSLLIHGNNHLYAELGACPSLDAAVSLLAQGLSRMHRLETRAGIKVSRVMAPPHGASSPHILEAMFRLGYEGATISPGSLRKWLPDLRRPPAFGLAPAEFIRECAIIPRFRLSADCEGAVVISAFLDRPIIPVGHHDTLAAGLELLARVADTVNSLGDVQWISMTEMFRTNYSTLRDGETLHVLPFSNHFDLTTPEGVRKLVLEPSDPATASRWTYQSPANVSDAVPAFADVAADGSLSVAPRQRVQFRASGHGSQDFRECPRPTVSPWAVARRILCEARDRVSPLRASIRKPFARTLPQNA